jgi:hypothetical protein
VLLSGRRVNAASGIPFEDEQLHSVRRVVRQADGRWLVREQVEDHSASLKRSVLGLGVLTSLGLIFGAVLAVF